MTFKKFIALGLIGFQLLSVVPAIAEDSTEASIAVENTEVTDSQETEAEVPSDELRIYVSTDGSDLNDGSFQNPLKTISAGITKGSELKSSNPNKTVSVNIRGGEYYVKQGFQITTSGTKEHPFIIQAYNGEQVNIRGSHKLTPGNFTQLKDDAVLAKIPSQARKYIGVYDLKAEISGEVGQFVAQTAGGGMSYFIVNDVAQTIARWPNEGFDTIYRVLDTTTPGVQVNDGASRMSRWKNADNAYLCGYFGVEYDYSELFVTGVGEWVNVLTKPYYGFGEGNRYFIQNLIEELDSPGEYYIDQKTKKLYYYPPYSLSGTNIEITTMGGDMFYGTNLSNVTIKGIGIKATKGNGIKITNSNNIIIDNCDIRNIGTVGINMTDCTDCTIKNNNVFHVASYGINISGGDRQSLIMSNNLIENNHLYDFANKFRVYNPGINMSGVGITVQHNLIHNSSSQGILLSGNEHKILYNEMYGLVNEMSDAGAIYMGRDYTMRGNEIAYNYIHDIDTSASKIGSIYVAGIYLDDLFSSADIHHNILENCHLGVMIGGGRDNNFDNNILVDCDNGMFMDGRGVGWAAYHAAKGGLAYNTILTVPYDKSPWAEKYPNLATILDNPSDLGKPMNNSIQNNVMYNCMSNLIASEMIEYGNVGNNYEVKQDTSIFVDYENRNFAIKPGTQVAQSHPESVSIDMDKMGLLEDKRKSEIEKAKSYGFRLISPKNGEDNISNLGYQFMWDRHSGSDRYRVDIATDPEMKNIILSQETNTNSANVKYIPSGKQALWWTVTGINTSQSMMGEFAQTGAPRLLISTLNEKTDTTELSENLDKCQQLYSGITEGTKGGTFKRGYKDLLKEAIDEATRVIEATVITQKEIEAASEKAKNAADAFKEYINYDVVNVGEFIKDEANWKYPEGYMTFGNDGTLTLIGDQGRKNHYSLCYYDQPVGDYTAVKFGYKVNVSSNYCIIGIENNDVFLSGGYDLVIKSNQIEIQRRLGLGDGSDGVKEQILNFYISEDKWVDLEFGAIKTKIGTYIFLKADGYLVTDFLDTQMPFWSGNGRFTFTNPSGESEECVASIRAAKE